MYQTNILQRYIYLLPPSTARIIPSHKSIFKKETDAASLYPTTISNNCYYICQIKIILHQNITNELDLYLYKKLITTYEFVFIVRFRFTNKI